MVKTFLLAGVFVIGLQSPAVSLCRQALALGLDVSSSVDAGEYAAQIDGLAQALNDAQVRRALTGTTSGHVALLVYEWSGKNQQTVIQPWIEITTNGHVDHVVANLLSHSRSNDDLPTALGFAMGFGAVQLASSPVCHRHTLDISGDGVANEGYRPSRAIMNYDFANTVVNALVVGAADADALSAYFQQEVIHGFGAFVEIAHGYEDYARAMKRKLLRELTVVAVSQLDTD